MMFDSSILPVLLAQEQNGVWEGLLAILKPLAVFLIVFVLPFVAGSLIAKGMRMRGYEWRIGLIFFAILAAATVLAFSWNPEKRVFDVPLGVDLKGGTILIYEVESSFGSSSDQEETAIDMPALMQALTDRINPSGTKEIVVRPYGDRQVEIIIPDVESSELENIKRRISTAGSLEFRIVANSRDHSALIALAQEQARDPDPARRIDRRVVQRTAQGIQPMGFWARAAKEKLKAGEVPGTIVRNAATGEMIDMATLGPVRSSKQKLDDYLAENGLENIDILLATDDDYDVTGEHLGVVAAGNDEYLQPCVNFRMQGDGVAKFRLLTTENLPDMSTTPPFYRHLGIMLDDRLLSFPRLITTISDNGRITGDFTADEVNFLVGILRAGKLPATLTKEPISENNIGSMLGDDTIQRGKTAIAVSLIAVLVFVAFYYQFAGIVACMALLTNLLLVLAVMVVLKAPVTLPGLAGLVLTVGMSVDANVLIFERIREEMARGAALRMAIRNGFSKATTTIVDANVTTLITAVVLYAIGTDQIRGFAVTLILGILMSMFTAIFCSRVVFDIAERRQWIKQLRMMRILGSTHVDFVAVQRLAIIGSVVLMVIGLVAVVTRGREILDIDFRGGVSVTMVLQDSMPPDQVRARLDGHFQESTPPVRCTVNRVDVEGRPDNSVYKIDARLDAARDLELAIQEVFRDPNGQSLLQAYSMEFADVRTVPATPGAEPSEQPGAEAVAGEGRAVAKLTLGDKMNAPTLRYRIRTAYTQLHGDADEAGQPAAARDDSELLDVPGLLVDTGEMFVWDQESGATSDQWYVSLSGTAQELTQILERVSGDMAQTPVFPSSSKIGGQVAGDTRDLAILALTASLFGILAYIWIRFQRVLFGVAAVIALVHDVLIVLGAIALSAYVSRYLGFLLIDEFKINLPMVAALLTIMGYSLNDTIVVFDRIREVRGKSPDLTSDMVNASINQTLSRTLLTSLTTMIVAVILYAIGGQGIHGFAFALVVGVLVGTYSSIFIAAPALLWMFNRARVAD